MRLPTLLAIFAAFFSLAVVSHAMDRPAAHTKGIPVDKPAGELKPGEYWWNPALSPNGPLMILVSVPKQTMHVYRNGILIGRSTVSTGAKGHSTPGGVFTILEKKKTHRSKKYNNAPMPNMQRLTWSGIAMHSGNLPGFPASHGCIRLPYDFSQLLFTATEKGGTVVVGDGKVPTPYLADNPGQLLAPKDFTPKMLEQLGEGQYEWQPERSKTGPITIVVSSADKMMYVYRGGNPIGRAVVEITGWGALGEHVFSLLEGATTEPSKLAPGRNARRWMSVKTEKAMFADADKVASRLRFNPEFATKVDDILTPGTTVIVTEREVVRKLSNESFFEN
ncbi:L,D-transpeptidase [Luteolibacter arcticus]|uniref:L,D-transpeptidase n=1 Tax=Luteolibacter arcticus TaxID=1581411 RepID=A0ABT3GFI9_9BACT|nr:L,D-transpeptidase [Luteolibacter arcticus]MCW1922324.1 L,D-transpeptidase [Luteolibacter arcticus]